MKRNYNALNKYAPLLLRIGLAVIFIVHGLDKLFDISGFTDYYSGIGIPAPNVIVWVAAIFELVGGILVLIGWYTRVGAIAIGIVIIGALIFVKFAKGFYVWERELALLVITISLILSGPGYLSIDSDYSSGDED